MKISKKDAETILSADLANILKKLKAGKTLSAGERAVIQAQSSGVDSDKIQGAYAKSHLELASIIGVTTFNLRKWQRLPNAPRPLPNGGHDIAAWLKFKESGHLKDSGTAEYEDSKTRRMKAQAEKLELENAIRRNEYSKNSEVEADIARMIRNVCVVIDAIPRRAAMTCAGRSAPDVERVLADMIDEARRQLHEGKWSQ